MRSLGKPEASPALHNNRIVSSSAARSGWGTGLPFFSSRLMIPLQAAAVSKDSIGTVGSKTSNNDDTLSVLGQAEVARVARSPPPQIPDFFHCVDNCLKRGTFVRRKEARDIFQDDPPGANRPSQVNKLEEESAAGTVES
tara:strand:+ start:118 stop:537 length:420 start_codon:yes stop_codon:yes gene_type:complete